MSKDFVVSVNEKTGQVSSVKLYGNELLDTKQPSNAELIVNGVPLKTRIDKGQAMMNSGALVRMKGEHFVDHFSGWGLVVNRDMGPRDYAKFPSFGIHYLIRRELADMDDLPCPGPGGPVVEAPLYVDTFSLMNWNWKFWGDDTRMIFPSLHSSGPTDEFGHVGYENDTPEQAKKFMQNVWRRIYPGVMAIHGGMFYNAKTGHWLAITCRRPHVGYILNITDAGRGVGYDFTLHAPFGIGEALQLPEVKLYYGKDHDSMMRFMADYIGFYYEKTPEWVYKTLWGHGLSWNNKPSWTEQADEWERILAKKGCNGINYCLVTNRPLHSGTTPMGYEPDPNHGSIDEFKRMCRRIADKGIPILVWMSHSGLLPQGGIDIDDDWFIRGIDGRVCASWGSVDGGMSHCNPGHPGYIEYTKKWIRFYMKECGVKGFFLDCLGWAFPPDFRKRDFMRFPGDTNRMAVKFITEVYNCIKECDPEGLLFGEGTTLEAPVNLITMGFNPVRAIDGMGPRDFMLSLNDWTDKRFVLDQGASFSAACGYVTCLDEDEAPGNAAKNQAMQRLLEEFGGERAFKALPGDLGILESQKLLVVPRLQGCNGSKLYPKFTLPKPWDKVATLTETTDGSVVKRAKDKSFRDVPPGIYRMK